ncbi:MAG: SRPBCC family protein [Mycobacteriales bacterium]
MTAPPTTISRSLDVDAPPEVVWQLVSDLPKMGELSPENTGGSWLGGASGPAVGARFRGANRRGWRRWSTQVAVTECDAGRRFAFEVTSLGMSVARWSYDVAARPGGCTVTESWSDQRGPAMGVLGRLATGVADRTAHTAESIERTLAAVKSRAEQP